jgi:3-oxoacyl-[acyl-carrier-protein] synthase III
LADGGFSCSARKAGFKEEISFNLSNACASSVDAYELAWNLVLSGKYRGVFVVTASAWESKGGQAKADLTDQMAALPPEKKRMPKQMPD